MDKAVEFENFYGNLVLQKVKEISTTYKNITKKLNDTFYSLDSDTRNSLQVGSYGRFTAINSLSDLDMLFIMPVSYYSRFDNHEGNGQRAFLQEVSKVLQEKYPKSKIYVDGQVVVFEHSSYLIEIIPCFEEKDGSFKYPDTSDGGSWKITKPRLEAEEIGDFHNPTGKVLRKLCKMTRAWRNKCNVQIGGLLIDTLCYNFLKLNPIHHNIKFDEYDVLFLKFFEYLKELSREQQYWHAPGSNQKVYKKDSFTGKAKKAFNNVEKAIGKDGKESARRNWKYVFGSLFPNKRQAEESTSSNLMKSDRNELVSFNDTEEFIDDMFSFRKQLKEVKIDCKVTQDGFRTDFLSRIKFLRNKYDLEFFINEVPVSGAYDLYWKVTNYGDTAERRDCVRGQIIKDKGYRQKKETSDFNGEHLVECYIVQNHLVVAQGEIDVNINMH